VNPLRQVCVIALLAGGVGSVAAQQVDPARFAALRWRSIGPFRGGRTVAAVGLAGHPGLFYIGVNNGGVWRSTDYGRVWTPIFDEQPTGSIGALAVAPSDPNVIYVGSGEGLQRPDLSVGDGVYKSTDGGATWRNMGLREGQQIPVILVDPKDPNRVFVAVLGHPYGPNPERGIYRSTDGGATWLQVLAKDENTGGMDLACDPVDPNTVYAVLWAARQAPWEIGSSWTLSTNNGLYKSSDGGTTWRQLGTGLPSAQDGLGRIGLGVAPSDGKRIYAVVGATRSGGLYRSDDAGESWRRVNADPRLWGRDGDFNEVKVDPRNPDVLYVANVVTWKSTDGGQTFQAFRGAPGGDDYHRVWIDPGDSRVILIASDQGAIVTVNGGESWSSWYNQPTAQFYHVATDNRFPYWVYGGQQESGSAGVASRGNDGQVTDREWHPVGAEEYGYVAPDPLHPNLVYGGKLTRFDWNTGDVQDVAPDPVRSGQYRFVRTMPVLFSPVDPHVLYFAGDVVFKTLDGGRHWQVISPDLTRPSYDVPANLGAFTSLDPEHGQHRGVVYTIAPSFRRGNLLWAGTDDGLIWVTHTGGRTWKNVTPDALTPWSKVSLMEASHVDTLEAYAAVNRFRLDDVHPHIYRTKDGGKTWSEIVAGIPANEVVNVVREDPVRRGLLFAGSERSVYVSFDDGDHWQALRLNLPASSVRDLVVHGNDLVIATHGRGFWILDDLSPLRQLSGRPATGDVVLFRPGVAYRVRWNKNTDTPLPPDEPTAHNPPDGAILYYFLGAAPTGPIALEVRDAAGRVVRRFASDEVPEPPDSTVNIPPWWIRPPQPLSATAGMHRFVWDLRGPPPAATQHGYPIAAVYRDTPREPRGPIVVPGRYTVRLTVDGRLHAETLSVRMDPRVTTPPAGLVQQHRLATQLADAMREDSTLLAQVRGLRARLKDQRDQAGAGPRADSLLALDTRADSLENGAVRGQPAPGRPPQPGLARLAGQLAGLYDVVEETDAAPTSQAVAGVAALQRTLAGLRRRWSALERAAGRVVH